MALTMNQDFFERFGKRREIEGRRLRRGVSEGELLGQNGFTCTWRAHDHADCIRRNPAHQHFIKTGTSGWYFLSHQDPSPTDCFLRASSFSTVSINNSSS